MIVGVEGVRVGRCCHGIDVLVVCVCFIDHQKRS